jgi:hypothetical protein
MTIDQLSPNHRYALEQGSAISPEVIAARGYRTITAKAELRRLGFSDIQSRVPTLLLPVWGVQAEVMLYQSRPDAPRIRDSKPIKYETPAGSHMALDVPPVVRVKLADPQAPLFITEGVKKADALASQGCCAVALLGVWNWRGTNEQGGKLALPDWDLIALNGRRVYICFDSDVMLKPQVYQALARLKDFLESRGATVALIYLPPGEGAQKVGVDDYLAAGHSVDDLLTLATGELCSPPPNVVPEVPYQMTSQGIIWLKATRDSITEVPLANFQARITADIAEDDGAELRHFLELEAELNGHLSRFIIPVVQFKAMGWVTEQLGAKAVVFPGFGLQDHLRAAIQLLSSEVVQRQIYSHTGWRKLGEEWVYLHAGGAIGQSGLVPDVTVHLPDALAGFRLPAPPTGAELATAIRASLAILDLATDQVTVPNWTAIWRAVLGEVDLSEHTSGPTGAGKTELIALIQQHFGPGLDARHLPGSWSSTGNALEELAFVAKDAVIVVDDFVPTGSTADVQRAHREADRVLRSQGNQSGRQRMRADATLRPSRPPRGLILSTGEDIPRGQSLRARLLGLELPNEGPGSLSWERLTSCQRDAAAGLYAQALAGFVWWLASRYQDMRQSLPAEVAHLRGLAYRSGQHRRTPDMVANLAVGLHYFLAFAQDAGALTPTEAETLWHRGWRALGEAAAAQAQHQAAVEPVARFLELLSAVVASGRAHVAAADGAEPPTPEAWGWRKVEMGTGDHQRNEWRPQGQRIGWVEGEDLYLEPDAAFAAAQGLAKEQGDHLSVTLYTLKRRLKERHLLASTEQHGGKERLEVRRTLEGQRRMVLHLNSCSLIPPEVPQVPPIMDSPYGDQPNPGALLGAQIPSIDEKVPRPSAPNPASSIAVTPRDGALGAQISAGTHSDEEGIITQSIAGEDREILVI